MVVGGAPEEMESHEAAETVFLFARGTFVASFAPFVNMNLK